MSFFIFFFFSVHLDNLSTSTSSLSRFFFFFLFFNPRASPRTSAPGSGSPPPERSPAGPSTGRTTTRPWCTWERGTPR